MVVANAQQSNGDLLLSSLHPQFPSATLLDQLDHLPPDATITSAKKVRFHEHDPREGWKGADTHHHHQIDDHAETNSWDQRLHAMRKQLTAGCSWHSLRMLLMDWLFLAILGIGLALTSMFMDNAIELLQTREEGLGRGGRG